MNLREMLIGDVVRMRYVRRFNTCRVLSPETVAEHVAFTGLYALMIGLWVQRNSDYGVNFGTLLTRALIHDIEETKTGDFPRPYKYHSKALTEALDVAAHVACGDVLAELALHDLDYEHLFKNWKNAKDGTVEGRILSFADFLSAISFIAQETLAGNKSMGEHVMTCAKYLQKFEHPDFDFIRPLVKQARAVYGEVFDRPEVEVP